MNPERQCMQCGKLRHKHTAADQATWPLDDTICPSCRRKWAAKPQGSLPGARCGACGIAGKQLTDGRCNQCAGNGLQPLSLFQEAQP